MTPEQRQQSIDTTDTMKRHNLMYQISANNPDKGVPGGDCNVTQCQKPGASSYNHPMKAFYCEECGHAINAGNQDPFVDVLPDHTLAYGENPEQHVTDLPTEKLNSDGSTPNNLLVDYKTESFSFGGTLPFVRSDRKVGRNETCPCKSGKKYKKCCINA